MQMVLLVDLISVYFFNIAFFSSISAFHKRHLSSQSFDLHLCHLEDVLAQVLHMIHLHTMYFVLKTP